MTYIKNFFSGSRVLGDHEELKGLVGADQILQQLVNTKVVPGIAVAVQKKGEKLLQKGYGYSNLEDKIRVSPEKSIFRIASVSKPISAIALATMVQEGTIDLEASFYQYVPYFPKKQWDFTIRQLASHTAGIRGYKGMEYGLNIPYSIKEGISVFKEDDLLFKPGTDYHYNSYDWTLISLAMQEASGVPFEAYVKEKVLQPAGMMHTFAPNQLSEKDKRQLTTFYSKNRCGFRNSIPVENMYKLAGGGFLSTATDITSLGAYCLHKGFVLPKLQEQFLTAQHIQSKSTYYGLGWQVSRDAKGRSYYGHIGNGVGGYSNFFVYPEQEMVITILINCTDPKIQPQLDKVVSLLVDTAE